METNSSGSGEACPASSGPSPLLLLPALLSLLWVLVDLFYSSSLLGWAVTRLAGAFLRGSAIHLGKGGAYTSATAASVHSRAFARIVTTPISVMCVGAVQVSLLTGRVLFKDFHYYCRDFSIRY